MALYTVTASTDFAGKSKQLHSWHLSQGTGAGIFNFRDGGAAGPVKFQVQLATGTSASQSYSQPFPVFVNSLYLEAVNTGLNFACVDLG